MFALEMVIKMVAMGIVMNKGAYLRDSVRRSCGVARRRGGPRLLAQRFACPSAELVVCRLCGGLCGSDCLSPPPLQWNYIDFVVVVFGFLSLLPGVGKISAFRVVRVLRPLKTLNKLRGLRVIVLTLLSSLSQLSQAVILILFLFTVYSIVGVQVMAWACRSTGWGVGVGVAAMCPTCFPDTRM